MSCRPRSEAVTRPCRYASSPGDLYEELVQGTAFANGEPPAESLAKRALDLMTNAGLPTRLSQVGVSKSILPILAEEANQQWTARFNPRPVTEADLLRLYEAAW